MVIGLLRNQINSRWTWRFLGHSSLFRFPTLFESILASKRGVVFFVPDSTSFGGESRRRICQIGGFGGGTGRARAGGPRRGRRRLLDGGGGGGGGGGGCLCCCCSCRRRCCCCCCCYRFCLAPRDELLPFFSWYIFPPSFLSSLLRPPFLIFIRGASSERPDADD